MTRVELCAALQAPADAAPGELLAAWERRRSELAAALARDGVAKPVKLRLQQEMRRCEDGAGIAAELGIAKDIDRCLAEGEEEWEKPAPARAVLRLCLQKAKSRLGELPEGELRFGLEKRCAAVEDRLEAEPPSVRAAAAPAGPDPRPGASSILELRPLEGEVTLRCAAPTIRMIARSRLTIGRKGDLTAYFWPENEENRQKTSTISRINTTLFLRGNQICVQDGQVGEDGAPNPSKNGTIVDDRRLTAPTALNFLTERRLKLGQFFFELRALHLPATVPGGLLAAQQDMANAAVDTVQPASDGPSGCIRIWPAALAAPPILGIWIFTEAVLGSGPDAAMVLDSSLPAIAARIHYCQGRFWLAVPSGDKSVVTLDRRRRLAGDIVPLQATHQLTLGETDFALKLL